MRPDVSTMHEVRQTLAAIRRVAQASQGDHALHAVLGRICTEVATSFDLDDVWIARLVATPEGETAVGLAAAGTGGATATARVALADSAALTRARDTGHLAHAAADSEPALPVAVDVRSDAPTILALPLLSEGRCIGFVAGNRGGRPLAPDETENEALETIGVVAASLLEKELRGDDLRRLDTAKTQFVAFASHELRAPIQAVYGVLSTLHLRGGELRDEQLVELRAAAYEQADRLKRLVDQLLDLSHLDASVVAVIPRPTHVRRLVEEIVLLVAEQQSASVEIVVADDLEVEVDPSSVERIVSNLLINAFRYGAPPVRIAAAHDDCHLRLEIEDSGCGVPPDFVPILFERFTRSGRSVREAEGSGLGLSIARAYAHAHGGDIRYSDVQPHGARFEVLLPTPRA